MIRETFADKYNEEVRLIIRELFNICKLTIKHPGDLLVCQQNGFIGLGTPCLGPGETGLNYMQQLNQIVYPGIGKTTNDNDCFVKSRSIITNHFMALHLRNGKKYILRHGFYYDIFLVD